jgi:hypothetical protein
MIFTKDLNHQFDILVDGTKARDFQNPQPSKFPDHQNDLTLMVCIRLATIFYRRVTSSLKPSSTTVAILWSPPVRLQLH